MLGNVSVPSSFAQPLSCLPNAHEAFRSPRDGDQNIA
jgi:hypothetical protein